jgi:hypothetical protein
MDEELTKGSIGPSSSTVTMRPRVRMVGPYGTGTSSSPMHMASPSFGGTTTGGPVGLGPHLPLVEPRQRDFLFPNTHALHIKRVRDTK